MQPIILLTNEAWKDPLLTIAANYSAKPVFAHSKDDLVKAAARFASSDARPTLISFATGVIVPEDIVDLFVGRAYNVHPAPPEYPGRDPHHFAAFDQVVSYGATTHIMTRRVDAGPIVDVARITVAKSAAPQELMQTAEEQGLILIGKLLDKLARGKSIDPTGETWGPRKTTRLDFEGLCRISALDCPDDVELRLNAVSAPGYQNAYLDLNGYRFRHEGQTPNTKLHKRDKNRWADFTEDNYRGLLEDTKKLYKFATYLEGREGNHVIWRHDMDYSMHQARVIAAIEREHDVISTFMFALRLPYYNVLEHETQKMARDIISMGHKAGLHFDVASYEKERWAEEELEDAMVKERDLLSQCLEAPVEAVSYHDPTCGNLIDFDKDDMAGMVNCYGKTFKSEYGYCSDSNGYWRHERIPDVIKSGKHEKIQVLTHPEWWTPTAMPPRQRIERAQLKRIQDVMKFYDNHLKLSGRKNDR